MSKKTPLELHTKPKQPIQVNRPLIITVVIVIVTVLLLAIITAFNKTNLPKTNPVPIKTITDETLVISPELKGLPENYSDINAIKKYSGDSQNDEAFVLSQQLQELQSSYLLLKRQLAAKAEAGGEKKEQEDDPDTKPAKTSGMIFAGLSSGVENPLEPQSDKLKFPGSSSNQTSNISPTEEQAELFKKQAQDKQKVAVIKASDNPEDIYDLHNVITPASPYQILSGTMISATLITGIDTSIAGTVIAQVRSDVYNTVTGRYLLIPRGSKLLGDYDSRVSPGQRRILIAFNRIIRPDGSSILLGKSFSADLGGHAGLEGNVNNHWGRILGAATISTIFSVGAGVASDRMSNNNNYPNSRQNALLGGSKGITDVGNDFARREMGVPPTITLAPGHDLNIAVRKDIVLSPYRRRI